MKATTAFGAREHLRGELRGLLIQLREELARQRGRGRSPLGDSVGGLVIEPGEAEGLIATLGAELGIESDAEPERSAARTALDRRAEPARTSGTFLPLHHAVQTFDLDDADYCALLLALAVEVDARFGRLIAYLNDHVQRTRPTLGLALALGMEDRARGRLVPEFAQRPFLRDGLVELEGDGPLPGRGLKLSSSIIARLANSESVLEPGLRVRHARPGRLESLVVDAPIAVRLKFWIETARRDHAAPILLLAGGEGSGRRTLAHAVVSELGTSLVELTLPKPFTASALLAARREARWHRAALLVSIPAGTDVDWSALWAGLVPALGPVLLAIPDDAVAAASAEAPDAVVLRVTEPSLADRPRLWRALLPEGTTLDDSELAELSARFRFGPGRIARTIRRGLADAALEPAGARRLTLKRLEAAGRDVGSAAMGTLAQKMPLPYRRDDLVVPATVDAEIDLALAWVGRRQHVLSEWGFAQRIPMGHGLSALFSGPPGTGKTMAAQVLAGELGLDLYRVDLSRIMSKFIGETERNLAQIFDEAQSSGCVLFFDEADALFGKRSEVKDAHDRYANVEIGYLLQRMEQFDGTTVLSTNRARDMDEAFVRRFQVMIEFPLPIEADRLRIWRGMVPDIASEPGLELEKLAHEFEVSGGEIKNAALAAAFLASAEGARIGMRHLRKALLREMKKAGKVVSG